MLVYFIQRPEGEFTEKTKLCQQGKQQQKQKKAIMWVSVERKENCYFIWKAKMFLGSLWSKSLRAPCLGACQPDCEVNTFIVTADQLILFRPSPLASINNCSHAAQLCLYSESLSARLLHTRCSSVLLFIASLSCVRLYFTHQFRPWHTPQSASLSCVSQPIPSSFSVTRVYCHFTSSQRSEPKAHISLNAAKLSSCKEQLASF